MSIRIASILRARAVIMPGARRTPLKVGCRIAESGHQPNAGAKEKRRGKFVFRHLLHPIVRLLMVSCWAAAAAPALAADVDDVRFIVTIDRSSEAPDKITAELRVTGNGLVNGSITFPASSTIDPKLVVLQKDGSDLARGIAFASEDALAQVFPAGNYVLEINNSAVDATIAYETRPLVPSPAIELPDLVNGVLPPGPVTVLFTKCAVCSLAGDSVEAELEGDATASETLTSADEEWTAPDGMGGDLLLGENLDFLTRITHATVRQKFVPVTGEGLGEDGLIRFDARFIQSDEVGFGTGFPPPQGDFCVEVNAAAPPAGCSPLDDALMLLLDTSGTVVTSVAGHDVQYTFAVGAKGTLTGTAVADLDDNGSQETTGQIKGSLKGKAGVLKQKLSFSLANETLLAKIKVSVADELSILGNTLARVQKASGKIGDVKIKQETPSNGPLPVAPQGWRVNFTVDADGQVQNGLLTLDGGRTFALVGTHKFNFASGLSNLKLQTAPDGVDKGIKIQLKQVELDDDVVPTAVEGGDLTFKILGQSGKASLPVSP